MRPRSKLVRLRELSLTLPEAVEVRNGMGNPSFQVGRKILVRQVVDHHGDGETDSSCKARQGAQLALTSSDPEH